MSKTMKAAQFKSKGAPLEIVQVPIPTPAAGQVRIKVHACGVCHTDAGVKYGARVAQIFPIIPGHEVVGVIDALGDGIDDFKVGDHVGVGWFGGCCGKCGACNKSKWVNCDSIQAPGDSYNGGYAEYMVAPRIALARLPKDVKAEEVAPLMCAGITTFNALRHSGAIGGDVVVVQGLGGLGHLGVQFAAKLGFHTVVVSRGADKEEMAKKLGAHKFINAEKEDAIKEIKALGGAKVILATAPHAKAVQDLIPALGVEGKLLIVSLFGEPLQVNVGQLLAKNQSIQAWASGDSRDIQDTVKFAVDTGVKSMNEIFPLEKAEEAFQHMLTNKARFRAVLKISD